MTNRNATFFWAPSTHTGGALSKHGANNVDNETTEAFPGLPSRIAKALIDGGIDDMETLKALLDDGLDLAGLDDIGKARKRDILEWFSKRRT